MSKRGAGARALLSSLAVLLVALSVLLGVAPAGGDAPDRTGWWWQPSSSVIPVTVPPPPGTPPGGLFVANDPGGARAIGGVHLTSSATTPQSLKLVVASQVGTPTLLACTVTGPWNAADGGQWDERPTYDCATSSKGTASEDGSTISFDVSSLVRAGTVDVAVVPDPSASVVATFQVAFDKPGADAFTVEAAPTTLPSPPTTAAVASSPPPSPSFVEPVGGTYAPDIAPGFAPLGAPAVATGSAAAPDAAPPSSAVTRVRPLDSAWVRYVAATIFTLLVGAILVSNGVIVVPWLPAMADPTSPGESPEGRAGETAAVRGLGRFRQVRTGPAPPL